MISKIGILSPLRDWKNRAIFYSVFLFVLTLYVIFYLDSIRFHNYKKILFSLKKPVELVGFKNILSSISPDIGLNAKLNIISGKPYLEMDGFEKQLLMKENPNIRKRHSLHPTLNLALFGMGYASDFLLGHYQKNTLGPPEVEILENVYLYVYKEIINPISVNNISVNDHAISARIQFILLFSTYIKDYYPEKKELLRRLSKDFNICIGFLMDRNYFAWRTNHGIMQLKSLAQVAGVLESDKLKNALLSVFEERLNEIIPYHIGPDGAIYESASEYWLFIYDQFFKIAETKSVQNLKSVSLLKDKLKKSKEFINTIMTNDGFLQGLGDSYSEYEVDSLKYISIDKNRYYQFSNELIGASWSSGKNNYGVLFVSLDSPPNAHKLPEDLAIYLYVNHPVFSNTGTYSYDMSPERKYFQSEESQSTVSIAGYNYKEPDSSELLISDFVAENNTLIASGKKFYSDNNYISRILRINPEREINIRDSIGSGLTLVSYFNVHPKIKITKISKSEVLLTTIDSTRISFLSNNNIEITNGLISEKKEDLTDIRRLKITGNPIDITILLPESKPDQQMNIVTTGFQENVRKNIAGRLELKYKKPPSNIKELFISRALLALIVFSIVIFAGEYFFRSE